MKRVCMLRHAYYPDINPNQRNAETLVANSYEVDIICLKKKGTKSQEIIKGVRVFRLPVEHRRKGIFRYVFEYLLFIFLAAWKLTLLSLRRKYDVLEVSGIPDFLVFAGFFPKMRGTKIILHLLDHTPGVFADHFRVGTNHLMFRLLNFMQKACAVWADYILVTQSMSREWLIKQGIHAAKIGVVINTPDEDIFKQPSSTSINGNYFQLICHGSLVERYRVQTLIKAVPLLLKEIPELKVKIIGDGEYQSALEELSQTLGVKEYVEFTGRLPFTEIPSHIAQAHIGIVSIPTGVNPAMPQKLLEYLAMGKPAVTASFPTIKAYFDDNTMLYYEPDDEHDLARCVLELYRDPEKRDQMTSASVAIYQQYRWSTMKFQYLKAFEDLIARPRNEKLEKK